MDKQDDYILKSDTISTINSSSEEDSDGSEETVDTEDSSDIEDFKLKIKNNHINTSNNTNNDYDSDKLDETWNQMLVSIEEDNKNEQYKSEDPVISSLMDNIRNNNTLQSSVANIIDNLKPKEKRIVKTTKTFSI